MYISGSGSENNSSRISRCISVEVAVETIVAELVDVYQWKWQWNQ